MKLELLRQLLNEAPFDPHAHHLAGGDTSIDGESGVMRTTVMGLDTRVNYNADGEIVGVEVDSDIKYNRDLMSDLHQFVEQGGVGVEEVRPNFRDGMQGLSYQKAPRHGVVTVGTFDETREQLVNVTETTAQMWGEFTSMETVSLQTPLVEGYDENLLLLVPLEVQGETIICDLYFESMLQESQEFLDMVLYNDASGVVNNNLRLTQHRSAGHIQVRQIFNAQGIEL